MSLRTQQTVTIKRMLFYLFGVTYRRNWALKSSEGMHLFIDGSVLQYSDNTVFLKKFTKI